MSLLLQETGWEGAEGKFHFMSEKPKPWRRGALLGPLSPSPWSHIVDQEEEEEEEEEDVDDGDGEEDEAMEALLMKLGLGKKAQKLNPKATIAMSHTNSWLLITS